MQYSILLHLPALIQILPTDSPTPHSNHEGWRAGHTQYVRVARANNARYIRHPPCEIYGDPHEHPQKETYWGNVDPNGLRSVYDEAKRFAEALTMAYHRYHNINTGIVRIFTRMVAHAPGRWQSSAQFLYSKLCAKNH
jgi:UDP-glucose 4-epimerase